MTMDKLLNLSYEKIKEWLITQPFCPICCWGRVVWKIDPMSLAWIEMRCLSCDDFKVVTRLPSDSFIARISKKLGILYF